MNHSLVQVNNLWDWDHGGVRIRFRLHAFFIHNSLSMDHNVRPKEGPTIFTALLCHYLMAEVGRSKCKIRIYTQLPKFVIQDGNVTYIVRS